MKQEVKVSFYLKKNQSKKDNQCPVMARLSVGKSSETAFSTKMCVPVSLWASGRATGKSSAAIEINQRLDEIRASALSHYRELSAVKEKVTAEQVKNLVLGMASGQETLLNYFRRHNENFDKRVGVNRKKGTADSYWQTLDHVTTFLKAKYKLSDISFTALNRSFIEKFDLYLRVDCGLAPGTIVLLTTRLNTIVKSAVAEGIITTWPFAGYEAQRPEPKQKYLTQQELKALMTTPLTCTKHYLIRDLFLFSCWTGIPYCDMCNLTDEDLEIADDGELWIKTSRGKTGMDYELPLLEIPLQILERYRAVADGGRLLPMYCNSELNRELKIIARTCGIDKRLTFHQARHRKSSNCIYSSVLQS